MKRPEIETIIETPHFTVTSRIVNIARKAIDARPNDALKKVREWLSEGRNPYE